MRILFFVESGGPGGAEQVVLQLALGFRESGDDVAVATLRTGWLTEQLKRHSISHYQLKSGSRFDFSLVKALANLAKEYDVLHTHLFDSGVYGALAAKRARVPHVSTEHGDIHHINKRSFAKVKLWLLRFCQTRCTAVSKFTKQAMVDGGLKESQVSVVGNPIREEQFSIPETSWSQIGIALDESSFVWVHVANHRTVKDQATLLAGFAESCGHSKRPQTLLLVGDGPLREGLEAQVRELGLQERVQFLGFRNDVSAILSVADGCILSSRSEALPMSLLEAGAAGLVLVSSDVGGVRDIITPDKTGFLFPAGDAPQLGATLSKVVESPELQRAVSGAIIPHVRAHFSLPVVLTAYRALYTSSRGSA